MRYGSAWVPLQIKEWMPWGPSHKPREDRFARTGEALRARVPRREDEVTVLLVDAANVVGARPDGWWRDRPGATTRLLARLAAAGPALSLPDGGRVTEVVAVVEGQARDVPEPPGVRVVRAPGSGDDALVACAGELVADGATVVVATADRGLRDRLPPGVQVIGPGRLLAQLDATGDGSHTT